MSSNAILAISIFHDISQLYPVTRKAVSRYHYFTIQPYDKTSEKNTEIQEDI